jgi:hypothetical protein
MATQQVLATKLTPITFKDSGGDAVITLQNLATATGRKAALFDRGAGSKPREYMVTAIMQCESTVVVGLTVDLYLCQSDGTYISGNLGTGDEAFPLVASPNVKLIGSVTTQVTTAKTNFIKRFENVTIIERYFAPCAYNLTGVNLTNTANTCIIIFTPVVDDIQAAA